MRTARCTGPQAGREASGEGGGGRRSWIGSDASRLWLLAVFLVLNGDEGDQRQCEGDQDCDGKPRHGLLLRLDEIGQDDKASCNAET